MGDKVQQFYDDTAQAEWERLEKPRYTLELLTTLPLIERHFPAKARVADIGGGPGRYTVELAQRSHRVTLVELSEAQVKLAGEKLSERKLSAEALLQGDARDLGKLETGGYDAALVLGPMYHLAEASDRGKVLSELKRILKPGGVAIVAYLNAWGVLRVGLADFPFRFKEPEFVRRMLDAGRFPGDEQGFTEAFLSTPPRAEAELREAGFELREWVGCESLASGMHEALDRMAESDPEAFQGALKLAVEVSGRSPFRDTSEHLHFVVRRP